MDETKLYYFLSVARHLSFTKAAEDCHVVQSTVSKQVASLEQELGAPLFIRDRQTVRLTEAGQRLATSGEAMLAQYRTLNETARNLVNRMEHKLHLVVGPFESPLLARLVSRYRQTAPDVKVLPSYNTYRRLTSHLRTGSICLGLSPESCVQALSGAETVPLGTYRWKVAARRDDSFWTLPRAQQAVLEDQYVLTTTQNQFDSSYLHCTAHHYPVQGYGLGTCLMTTQAMIQAGGCITLLPEYVEPWLPPELRMEDVLESPLDVSEYLILNPADANPLQQDFFRFFRDIYMPR